MESSQGSIISTSWRVDSTNDVLTQALSKPEYPGRTRDQSKFVKQSQYFIAKRSLKVDTVVLSMRREIEELKEIVCGLCAKKDVEPSVYQDNMPTVDQHNSFKASCTLHDKQPGVSDPPTMPVDSQECKLFIIDELQGGQLLIAIGRAWMGSLPTDTIHGIPLVQGNHIEVPIPYTISGADMPAFLNFDDIYKFIIFQEISANCILVYLRYLTKLCVVNGRVEKFMFVSSTLISPVRTDTPDAGLRERADAFFAFLRNSPKG
ncbi:hypothetical protein TIFTF001_025249 [Ficus carica]|uniref:Uncharacterized protein n=1 Tax=Ficus carica TaxID=3494 RepID=A0AA88DE07_FICCA|nr:hypothetical protein TIFTF001_025249 [Ficus carica]